MKLFGDKPSDWRVVLTIHGIRTTGDWQRELTDVLTQHRFRHTPLGFGFFKAVSLLMPWSRARKVEWFRKVYSDNFANAERLPSVVAHSFGSYIVTKAMLKYDDIRFDKVILCGSIVSRKYPWSTVVLQRGQVKAVLNEAGGRDMWAGIVEWVVSDAGSSGVSGFEDTADGRVTQLIHERHQHSDYFYRQNFERRWIPFLSGQSVQAVIPAGDDGVNWKFAFTASVALAMVTLSAVLALSEDLRSRASDMFVSFAGTIEAATMSAAEQSLSPAASAASDPDAAVDGPEPMSAGTAQALVESKVMTEAAADTAQSSQSNASAAVSQRLKFSDDGDQLQQMYDFLSGHWMQDGPLPEKIRIVGGGRCRTREHVRAHIVFDKIDSEKAKVVGRWEKSTRTEFQFVPSQMADSPATIREGRRSCERGQIEGNPLVSFSKEAGVVMAGAALWNMHEKVLVTLNIEYCKVDRMECESSRFGKTTLPSIEKISEERIRLDEMMFVRPPPDS